MPATLVAGTLLPAHRLSAAVPNALPFQGRVSVDGVPFTGNGQFRFALLDAVDTVVWSSSPDAQPVDGLPDTPVALPVDKASMRCNSAPAWRRSCPICSRCGTTSNSGSGSMTAPTASNDSVRSAPGRRGFRPPQRLPQIRHVRCAIHDRRHRHRPHSGHSDRRHTGQFANPGRRRRLDSNPTFDGTVRANYFEGGGAVAWVIATGPTHQAVPNTGILANNADGPVVIALPTSPRAGDLVRVRGVGDGGWRVELPAGATLKNPPVPGEFWFPVGQRRAWRSIALSADGQFLAAVAQNAPISTSADGGKTWSDHGTSASWTSIASSADGRRLAATVTGRSIWTSDDYGTTWKSTSATTDWQQFVSSSADGLKLLAVERDYRLWVSDNGGKTWTPGKPMVAAWFSAASSANGQVLVAATDIGGPGSGVSVSQDGGATWPPVRRMNESVGGPSFVAASADGRELGVAWGFYGIWRSSDSGASSGNRA